MTSITGTGQRIAWDTFGEFLRRMRRRRGLSQEALCKLLNCHRTYIYRLEHGDRRPSRVFLRLLVGACIPSAEELAALRGFERLREYRCDALEQDD